MKILTSLHLLHALLLLGSLSACGPATDDDDSSDDDDAADDDDATDDDDDSSGDDDDSSGDDDDSTGDDDDSTGDGCDDPTLEWTLLSLGSWGAQFSCGHSLYTSTIPDSFRLGAWFNPPSSSVPSVGLTWSQYWGSTAASDEVPGGFEIQTGTNLSHYDCNDAIDPEMKPVVAQHWDPIAGSATMSVTALTGAAWPGGPMTFTGDVSIQGVVVELQGSPGTTCAVPDTVFTDLGLGWLPG